MKITKRKLIYIGNTRSQAEKNSKYLKLKNKVYSVYDMNEDFKKKLAYERNKKTKKPKLIYPKFYLYSQQDTMQKYPFYYYLIEDLERYSKHIGIDFKGVKK
jgi:hypothetical protein